MITEATGPVRYRSRYASSAAYLPGDYWVAVSVGTTSDEAPLRFPYTLTVEVQGEAEGTPAYDTDEKPFLVGQDAYSEVASGNPAPCGRGGDLDRAPAGGAGAGGLRAGLLRARRAPAAPPLSRAAARSQQEQQHRGDQAGQADREQGDTRVRRTGGAPAGAAPGSGRCPAPRWPDRSRPGWRWVRR